VVRRLPNYLFQTALATVSLIVILLLVNAVLQAAIVVAIASSAFIVFVVPHSVAVSPRRVIGGHAVAVSSGSLFSLIHVAVGTDPGVEGPSYLLNVLAALSVGTGILVMVMTNTEHPPAAGTALGLVIHSWSASAVAFVLVGAVILTVVRILLGRRLVNLI
jgi:CBS-domain-containing membrane protein